MVEIADKINRFAPCRIADTWIDRRPARGDIATMRNDAQTKYSPIELLGQIPLFKGCSKDELKLLDRATTRADYPAGHVLCREGSIGRELIILLDGQAVVERDGVQITVLGPADFIGEMSLLDGGPRSATVTTLGPVSTLIMLPREFWQVIDEVPPIAHKLLSTLATRLRAADDVAYNH
jgi:CRP/FNR family transcriptional regulator, cyclic AMP receptor protein